MEKTQDTIDALGLTKYIELVELDFYNWKPEPFDLMHFDISNHAGHLRYLKSLKDIILFMEQSYSRAAVKKETKWNG
jgi:hypothetical protein